MTVTTSVLAAAGTSLLKKALDDIYAQIKQTGTNVLAKSRSEVKETVIARSLGAVTKVKTIWNVEKEVSLYDFYYPTQIEFSPDVTKRVTCIREFGEVGCFVIQGTAGQGKSIFLRYLCGQELDPKTSSGRVPIFVELRRLREDFSFTDLLLQTLTKYKLPATVDAWNYLASTGKFVLLLDAFDEVEPALVDRTVADIEHLVDLHRETLQILISSRPEADIQKSSRFRVLKLAPLSRSDHAPFLKRICTEPEQAEALLKSIRSGPSDVGTLLTTPLMLTLLVILYKSAQTIPETVPKFYEELFDVLFYRHDNSKPGFRRKRYTNLDDGTLKRAFSAFCFYVRLQGIGTLTAQDLNSCCEQAAEACAVKFDSRDFKNELCKTVCLLQEDGFEVSFVHKSVAQYYAASFVRHSSDAFASQFYSLAKQAETWRLEAKFLSEIDRYRYVKYFEKPLILDIYNEVEIPALAADAAAGEKLSVYLATTTQIVFDFERANERPRRVMDAKILGWSSTFDRQDSVRSDLMFWWIIEVLDRLEESEEPLPMHETEDEAWSEFLPLASFTETLSTVYSRIGKHALEKLADRLLAAEAVLSNEERKTQLLAAFASRPQRLRTTEDE